MKLPLQYVITIIYTSIEGDKLLGYCPSLQTEAQHIFILLQLDRSVAHHCASKDTKNPKSQSNQFTQANEDAEFHQLALRFEQQCHSFKIQLSAL